MKEEAKEKSSSNRRGLLKRKKVKATNKDKQRFSELHGIISNTEQKIEEVLQQRLDTFNFAQMDEEQAIFYRKINEKLEELEEELLTHYEEQENLDKLIFS